jgi:hypothetical protein
VTKTEPIVLLVGKSEFASGRTMIEVARCIVVKLALRELAAQRRTFLPVAVSAGASCGTQHVDTLFDQYGP